MEVGWTVWPAAHGRPSCNMTKTHKTSVLEINALKKELL